MAALSIGVIVAILVTIVGAEINGGPDVVVLMDSSARIGQSNFDDLKDWLQALTEYWDIGPDKVQVSVVTYGNGAKLNFALNVGDHQKLGKQISALTYRGGSVDAAIGLQQVLDSGFTPANGARHGRIKVIIHVGAGTDKAPSVYEKLVHKAVADGIRVYNVYAGQDLTRADLIGSTSTPEARYLFVAPYGTLGDVMLTLAQRIKTEIPSPGSTLPVPNGCMARADIAVVLDGSPGGTAEEFIQVKDFLNNIVINLPISKTGVHFALMQYGTTNSVEFQLGTFSDRLSLMNHIQGMKKLLGAGTRTDLALKLLGQSLFTPQMGARTGVLKIALVITDGHAPDIQKTIDEATNLRRTAGVQFLVVGIGSGTRQAELKGIAANNANVLQLTSFEDLKTSFNYLISALCHVVTSSQTTTTPIPTTMMSTALVPTQQNVEICKDDIPEETCKGYIKLNKGFCTYRQFRRYNRRCRKTCVFCKPIPRCLNKWNNCTRYDPQDCLSLSYQFQTFFQDRCAQFCGFCELNELTSGFHGKCLYNGKTYNHGAKWMDGCDYECVCTDGRSGKYECKNRCPVLYNIPSECTFVRKKGECCLQPVCNFNGTIQITTTTLKAYDPHGNDMCMYNGIMYAQGHMIRDDCKSKCQCTDASQGLVTCHDTCPTYDVKSIPPSCSMQNDSGTCCQYPTCSFNKTVGGFSGFGSLSGIGIGRKPFDPTAIKKCKDLDPNCKNYTTDKCQDKKTSPYMTENCPVRCGLCAKKFAKPLPGSKDKCYYQGVQYNTGDVWQPDCEHACVCDDQLYGYYRCYSKCPKFTEIPEGCNMTNNASTCCPELVCPGNFSIVSSTTNILSIGGGGFIYRKDDWDGGKKTPVVPKVFDNGTLDETTVDRTRPFIAGCLYNGRILVQGEIMPGSSCAEVCQCVDVSDGELVCYDKCPYYKLDTRCKLVNDTTEPCCLMPDCTSVGIRPKLIPQKPKTIYSLVEMPDPSTLISITGLPVTTIAPPKGKYCSHQGVQHLQGSIWFVTCKEKCTCDDAQRNLVTCLPRCPTYYDIPPNSVCDKVIDPRDPCCVIPVCRVTRQVDPVNPLLIPPVFPVGGFQITAPPRTGYCAYNGMSYKQDEKWDIGCDLICTCVDQLKGTTECVERCLHYDTSQLSPFCFLATDPSDTCCQVATCQKEVIIGQRIGPEKPNIYATLAPNDKPENASRCVVDESYYYQGNEWFENGCSKRCRCEDAVNDIKTCEDRCPSVSAQSGCVIVTDPQNVCCKMEVCPVVPDIFVDKRYVDSGLIPTLAPRVFKGEPVLPTPTPDLQGYVKHTQIVGCLYKGEKYAEGDYWYDGCDWTCSCVNASLGTYSCTDRCARFPKALPPQCKLVPIAGDFCCHELDCTQNKNRFTFPPALHGTGTTQPPLIVPTLPNGKEIVPPVVSPIICQDGGNVYTAGQTWFIGCDLKCMCEHDGTKRCESRCRLFELPAGNVKCTFKPDPQDASCCSIPECHSTETTKAPPTTEPRVLDPVAPPGYVIGYGLAPMEETEVEDPLNPKPVPTPKCRYNGQEYVENEEWQVGCKLTCTCTDASQGKYTCNDMCPRYPAPPTGCFHARDVSNSCCMLAFCPGLTQNQTSSNTTTTTPQSKCVYKNAIHHQGEIWRDGCDFTCSCDDAVIGKVRCNRMCKNYKEFDQSGCIWVTDPSNPCCRYPKCQPSTASKSTLNPLAPKVTYPIVPIGFVFGYRIDHPNRNTNATKNCEYRGNDYNTGDKWSEGVCGQSCVCVDGQAGQYTCTDRCPSYRLEDLPFYCRVESDPKDKCCQHPICDLESFPGLLPSPKPSDESDIISNYCAYKHNLYLKSQRWNDGCDFTCECVQVENKLVTVCEQRCVKFDSIPTGCSMVTDPSDADCCQIASCTPSVGTDGTLTINSTKPFVVTGVRGYKRGHIPQHKNNKGKHTYCVYDGQTYKLGQSWKDGCKRQCTCVDQTKGAYTCEDLCPTFTQVPQQCNLQQDPDNLCCQNLICHPTKSFPNPYMRTTPQPVGLTTQSSPTDDPNEPRPVPTAPPKPLPRPLPQTKTTTAVCTFRGAYFKQFEEFNLDCDRRCRCEAPEINDINCFNRCPIYSTMEEKCDLVVDPKDSCCQVRQCLDDEDSVSVVTPSPAPGNGTTKAPEKIPVPVVIPGGVFIIQSLSQLTNKGVCVYKGKRYKDQESWKDGCDMNCTCVDPSFGTIHCENICPKYIDIPTNCYIEKDKDNCCDMATCYSPGLMPTLAPPPSGLGGQTYAPIIQPVLSGRSCTHKGHTLTQGQSYADDNCGEKCVCTNTLTNHVACIPRCLNYTSTTTQASCQLVPDWRDPECCKVPKCKSQDKTNPYGVVGKYIAVADPQPTSNGTDKGKDGCFTNGQRYVQGQSWQHRCEICTCVNDRKHIYECTSLCPSYPDLPAGCEFEYNPINPCCPRLTCHFPVPANTTYCMYKGLAYKQGQIINTGSCSKVLRCEDSKTNTISQRDRCPKYMNSKPGCHLETSPSDSCCQILVCQNPDSDNPLDIVTSIPGKITGTSRLKTNLGPLAKGRVGCFFNNKLHGQGERWNEGCSMVCTCTDAINARFHCVERCAPIPALVPPTCRLIPDAGDQCCNILSCVPPQLLVPSTITAPYNISYLKPPVKGVCLFKGKYYRELQRWYEGRCEKICMCEDAARGIVQCRDVCPRIVNASSECLLVPDPQNPHCCQVKDCPATPTASPPAPGYLWQSVPPRIIYGKPDLTTSFIPGTNGSYDLQGCRYKGKIYQTNQTFDDSCDLQCVCLNATSGNYKCNLRCPTFLPRKECVLVKDPTDSCCQAQYCDFTNSKPFPGGIPRNVTLVKSLGGQTPRPYVVSGILTTPSTPTNAGPQASYLGFCLYEGSKYLQGQTWNIGCDKTCTCVNVTTGLYSCADRCLSFGDRAPHCILRPDPSDSCCLVPDCAPTFVDPVYPVTSSPNQTTTAKPNITINPGEVILKPGHPASYIKVVTRPPGYYHKSDHVNCLLEDESEYRQGSSWQDGNDVCTCVDAATNTIHCQQGCASYYFLPSSCRMVPNPSNSPCLLAVCNSTTIVNPIPLTQAPPVPIIAVRPTRPLIPSRIKNCVVAGFSHPKNSAWSDGCQSCRCINPNGNVYHCRRSCPVYTALPKYCTMVTDISNTCCKVPVCTRKGVSLTTIVGKGDNTTATHGGHNGTDTIPFPTHPVTTGSGHPPSIKVTQILEYGGSDACYYKGQLYRPGDLWNDGCDLTCTCELKSGGTWTCVQRCGELPAQLPRYCHLVRVPGQCCDTMSCDIPNVGHYNPPMTVYTVKPGQIPKAGPGDVTFLYPWPQTGVISVPGNGYTLTGPQINKIRNRCVRHKRAYTQGQKWTEGCDVLCECIDEVTGYYHCTSQCPSYHIPVPHCVMAVVPNQCCKQLVCNDPETGVTYNPILHPKPKEYIYGVVKPGFSGFRLGYVPQGVSDQFVGCYFNWHYYLQGQKWESGCGLQCTCVDGPSHLIECHDVCYSYTNVPSACSMTSDSNQCCQSVSCPVTDDHNLVVPTKSHRPVFNISEGSCIDTIDDCESYTVGSCGPQYATWAKDSCPRYCGLCYDTSLLAPACEDVDDECANLGQNACSASDTKLWMWKNCHKTCGYCDSCVDVSDWCVRMTTSSCHGVWEPWAKLMCAKTCNFCSDVKPTSEATGDGTVPSGWLLLLKGVSGVPNDLYRIWSHLGSLNAEISQAQDLTSTYPYNFKSFYADRFYECRFKKIRMAIYKNGLEKVSITFNANNTDKLSWFDESRIESSTWTDITDTPVHLGFKNDVTNVFFEVSNSSWSSCDGEGWMFVSSTNTPCNNHDEFNGFYYSPFTGASAYSSMEKGEVFAILAQGGDCNSSNPLPLYCPYIDHVYVVGEKWNIGCSQTCHCVDYNNSPAVECKPYECEKFTDLQPGCHAVKKPGNCCPTLEGPTCHGEHVCWDENSNGTRKAGDRWRVGCTIYDCKRVPEGFQTTSTSVCPSWDLSGLKCTEERRLGKCCAKPVCPGYEFVIPDQYKDEF